MAYGEAVEGIQRRIMNSIGKATLADIRKKQSVYVWNLFIELVTDDITEISTREVGNVLGEPM